MPRTPNPFLRRFSLYVVKDLMPVISRGPPASEGPQIETAARLAAASTISDGRNYRARLDGDALRWPRSDAKAGGDLELAAERLGDHDVRVPAAADSPRI